MGRHPGVFRRPSCLTVRSSRTPPADHESSASCSISTASAMSRTTAPIRVDLDAWACISRSTASAQVAKHRPLSSPGISSARSTETPLPEPRSSAVTRSKSMDPLRPIRIMFIRSSGA